MRWALQRPSMWLYEMVHNDLVNKISTDLAKLHLRLEPQAAVLSDTAV